MFRGFLSLSAGVLALLCITGMPGQLCAQGARGSFRPGGLPFTNRVSPGMGLRLQDPRFGGVIPGTGQRFMDPRFGGVIPGTNPLFLDPRFRGVIPGTNPLFLDPRFGGVSPGTNPLFLDPRFGGRSLDPRFRGF